MNENTRKDDNTTLEVQRDTTPTEDWNIASFVLQIIFPVAGLLVLFKQKHIFSRLLLQLDRNCVSVFCPSLSRREKLLKWAGSRLPVTWSSPSRTLAGGVAELWSDGSLLCTLINSAIPGACPNPHRHWKKPPLHAQAIAYKYLGVIPIFTENELTGKLTMNLERNFLHYLNELQQAIAKLSERNEIPKSISVHYTVRGMGLYSGEQHRKTVFYVYPNTKATGHNSNIIVHIKGPYATYGKAIIPNFHNDLFTTPEINLTSDLLTTKKILNGNVVRPKNSFIKNFSLPFMQYHKKHMGDNIVIDVTMEDDRAKVTYIPKNYGMYEIILVCNGELIRGCPFDVHILNNISGVEDNFDAEESANSIPGLRKRKVLSKTIDFIDEQVPLADILRKHKANQENTANEGPPELEEKKEKNTNSAKEENVVEISLSTLVPPQRKSSIFIQNTEKIDEEDEEICPLYDETDSNPDKSELNIENNISTRSNESILEKQNSESTNENRKCKLSKPNRSNLKSQDIFKVNIETRGVAHTASNYTDNRKTCKVVDKGITPGLQLESINESASNNKTEADVLEQKSNDFNGVTNTCSSNFTYNCPGKVEVNKIKIPDKFREVQYATNNNVGSALDTKYFKNIINTSNKNETPKSISIEKESNYLQGRTHSMKNCINDVNNNISSLSHSEGIENRVNSSHITDPKADKTKVVTGRFLLNQQRDQNIVKPLANPTQASPICPEHIVPEVENGYIKMSVAEKRKIFAKKIPEDTVSNSTNSSFSETENIESCPGKHFRQFEGLSVLNYLGSLKKSEYANNRNGYSLCATMSLPNISSMDREIFHNSVKERRNFWEKISSSSSSLSINSETSLKRKTKGTETERYKLIWKKPEVNTSNTSISTLKDNPELEKNVEISKSADDILSLPNILPYTEPKKYKSMDNSLDKCTIMSIDERKRMLLKQNYEKEKPKKEPARPLRHMDVKTSPMKFIKKYPEVQNEKGENDGVVAFCSISERIKKYDSACNLIHEKIEEETQNVSSSNNNNDVSNNISRNDNHEDLRDLSQPEILTVNSHFKRAIKYFKNLEEKSLKESKPSRKLKDYRWFSLEGLPSKYRKQKKGGSLNLPNISQRFSVSNLYEDVFGGRRGSFKGAVNRTALVEALATFSRRENRSFIEDEDKITYEIFQKRAKIKRRRSIKSIFDMYY